MHIVLYTSRKEKVEDYLLKMGHYENLVIAYGSANAPCGIKSFMRASAVVPQRTL